MHAVVLAVTLNDPDAAAKALQEQVVPMVSGLPGFVTGYWVDLPGNQGRAMTIYESEEAAQAAASQAQPPGDFVTFNSVEVGEVVAHA